MAKEIGSIPSLCNIKLYNNQIGGSVPKEIGDLTCLSTLDIEQNNFSGKLFRPYFFNLADSLVELRASINNFEGVIPDMSQFTELRKFWLANNTFAGEIPNSITTLTELGKLTEFVKTRYSISSLAIAQLY